jgi:diketogulonate reductase-like aldo/keto reductase
MTAGPNPGGPHARVLADSTKIPLLGLGVWQVPDGPECVNTVRAALDLGYHHIDTAQAYGNEESVGRALAESGVAREKVFVTTKFNPSGKKPDVEAERSLKRLGLDYVDLYIIHWPQGGPTWAWPAMERARELGYARSIGVSNFNVDELEKLFAVATIYPVVDQVKFSAFDYRRGLLDAAEARNVALEAYSPLGTGRYLSDKTVTRVAQNSGRTPAQVLLRWCVQHGLPVLAKSTHRERLAENAQIFDFTLSEAEMADLDALDTTGRTDRAVESKWW